MAIRKRKSRAGGEIYQVDLIAALFAGYTIVWIATSDKQEILEAQTELKLASFRASVSGTLQGHEYLQRAGVQGLSEAACVPDTFDPFIDTSKIKWQGCSLDAKPARLNKYNDSYSIVEAREPCANYSALQNTEATEFDSVLDASLLDVNLPSGLSLIGLGYGQSEGVWPAAPFGFSEDRIPKYIGIKVFQADRLWDPSSGAPPHRCSYDRDRERHIETLYVAEGFDQSQSSVTVSLNSEKGSDLIHVYSDSSSDAVSFTSPKPYEIFEAGGLRVQQDFTLNTPVVSLRLCVHEDSTAVCWSGDGALVPGASYTLNKEL